MKMSSVNLADIKTYIKEGVIEKYREEIKRILNETEVFEINTIYDSDLFEFHLVNFSTLQDEILFTSAVCRCIENGWLDRMKLLIQYYHKFEQIVRNKNLHLRRIKCFDCYFLIREYGFTDTEFEKRIKYLQQVYLYYRGKIEKEPILEKYTGPDDVDSFTYRQTIYFLRYNYRNKHIIENKLHSEYSFNDIFIAYTDFMKQRNGLEITFEEFHNLINY